MLKSATLPVSGKHMHALVPASELVKPEAERVAYLFRTPLQREKIRYRHAVAAEGGRRHGVFELLACLRQGIEALTDPAQLPDLDAELLAQQRADALALLDDHRDGLIGFYSQVSNGDFNLETDEGRAAFDAAFAAVGQRDNALADITHLVRGCYRPYARMMADIQSYRDIAGFAAADLFMMGWRNKKDAAGKELRFRRSAEGLSEETLAQIPEAHLREISGFIEDLLAPSEAQVKNSDSPRPSPSAPAISGSNSAMTEQPPTEAAGNSSASDTSETPG